MLHATMQRVRATLRDTATVSASLGAGHVYKHVLLDTLHCMLSEAQCAKE